MLLKITLNNLIGSAVSGINGGSGGIMAVMAE